MDFTVNLIRYMFGILSLILLFINTIQGRCRLCEFEERFPNASKTCFNNRSADRCPMNMIQGKCSTCQGTCSDPSKSQGCQTSCDYTSNCVCPEGFLLQNSSCVAAQNCVFVPTGSIFDQGGSKSPWFDDCYAAHNAGMTTDGVFTTVPDGWTDLPFDVSCDMTTDGGGWTVIQRRRDGSIPFDRSWAEYKIGFGNPDGEFWLGNDIISHLTTRSVHELRIDMLSSTRGSLYTKYDSFLIDDEGSQYKLTVGNVGMSTVAFDNMRRISGEKFTTKDRDNDRQGSYNCVTQWGGGGGWWVGNCADVFFNGQYGRNDWNGICVTIDNNRGYDCGLTHVEMKIRPRN